MNNEQQTHMFRINRSLTAQMFNREVLQAVHTLPGKSRRYRFSKKSAKLQNTEPLLKRYQSSNSVARQSV